MRFYTLKERKSDLNQIVLAKIKDIYGGDLNYYVLQYEYKGDWYHSAKDGIREFVEASGEHYMTVDEEDIIGWMPIEDLDEIKVGE